MYWGLLVGLLLPRVAAFLPRPSLAVNHHMRIAHAKKWDIELCSPSKINLFLRIVRRRDDGFHDLASLFQAIKLSDKLSMSLLPEGAPDDTFECDMDGVPVDRTNLVLRAVDVFRERTGNTRKFAIRLAKTVPAQAGLGGGSGNAATALWGCNELCKQSSSYQEREKEGGGGLAACSEEELLEMSTQLGSDATFFLSQGTAYCTGRGEVVTPLAPLPPPTAIAAGGGVVASSQENEEAGKKENEMEGEKEGVVYVVKPFVGLSTPDVFKTLDLGSCSQVDPLALLELHTSSTSTTITTMTGAEDNLNADGAAAAAAAAASGKFVNDLEPAAFACLPDLKRLKEKLAAPPPHGYGFSVVSMSGSGTSIFCLGEPAKTTIGEVDWKQDIEGDKSFPWPIKVFKTSFLNRPAGKWYSAD